MVRRYQFGTPILDTESVVYKPGIQPLPVPYLSMTMEQTGIRFSYAMEKDCAVYGLGESVRGINKRGFRYASYCSNSSLHIETLSNMYGAHNFLVVSGKHTFGVFVDSPGKVVYDIGFTEMNQMEITSEIPDFELYIIEGESVKDICRRFREIIGRSYIPPRWAFGYQQCRWGYRDTDEIRRVVSELEEAGFPLDAMGVDIDHMDDYKTFTLDPVHYGDMGELARQMREKNIHLVPNLDPGIKIEKGYQVYEEGVEKGYFCKDSQGKDFVGAVWPGRCHFPDFLRPEVRQWYGSHYRALTDLGVDGFWNDMNEPTLFFTDRSLKEALDAVDEARTTRMDHNVRRKMLNTVNGMANNPQDYKEMFHIVDGKPVSNDVLHNLYGFNMLRASSEGLDAIFPEKRTLIFGRSTCIGSHRYAGMWQGDNYAWWSHLLMNLKMLPSLNMCGYLYNGADLGGFLTNTSEDLLIRWTQLGVFTPLMRNHSAFKSRRQEPNLFGSRQVLRDIIRIRYMLIPYLYSEFMRCALENDLLFRPLAFDFPQDTDAREVEDQLLLGDGLMIAPIYTQNATGRYVYLPEDMLMVRLSAPEEREYIPMEKGHHYIHVALEEMVFFLRKNKVLPLATPAQNTVSMDWEHLELLCNVGEQSSYSLYRDDGLSKDYENPEHYTNIGVIRTAEGLQLQQSGAALGLTLTDPRT